MSKPKYTEHIPEILEMYSNGKTSAEITNYLNENYQLDASESSIRTICQRNGDQAKDKMPEENRESQETITAKKMEELIINESQMRMTARDFSLMKEKYQDAFAVFSIINNEFGEATEIIRKRAKRDKINFLIAGGMILIVVLSLFTGYHIGRCFTRIAFYYILALSCAPGGICVGIPVGLLIAEIRNKRRIKQENAAK